MVDFFIKLKNRLALPLPGQSSQMQMMPHTNNALERFSIDVKKGANEGAVLILLYKKDGKIYFPLTQRHEYDGVHSGQISFPGGKVEQDDSTVEQTALRETQEEIGIQQSSVKVLGSLTELFIIVSNFNVQPVVGYMDVSPKFLQDSGEVAHIIEVSLDELLDDSITGEKEILIRNKHKISAPYFNFNGHHVWGATAMVLAEFKDILKSL